MDVTITPKIVLIGEMTAPPSKAYTHRALFAGLLSEGVTEIVNPLYCDDTEATVRAVASLGASVERETNRWAVKSSGHPTATEKEINCGESGVTLRFTIPIASLTGQEIRLVTEGNLMRRPIEPLIDVMNRLGAKVDLGQDLVRVKGDPLKGGKTHIRGDVSSQFISGLLLAAPVMEEGLSLELDSPLESRGYVLLTVEIMKVHGIDIRSDSKLSYFEVAPKQRYRPASHLIPGDYSSAAFAMSAAAITGCRLLVRGLRAENAEPDSAVIEILSQMGVRTSFQEEGLVVNGGRLKACSVDIRDCPDLGPVTAVLGCFADGETRITGGRRLRYKESNRLSAVTSELRALGAEIEETEDGLVASGPCSLKGGIVHSHGDHRIAMALGVAAIRAENHVVIKDAECVSKSYPTFFDDLRSLGVEVIDG